MPPVSGSTVELRPVSFDHADAVSLIVALQQFHRERYGEEDRTPVDPADFAAPGGFFVVGYESGVPVACGGWRARDGLDDPHLELGDAEIKRMYVAVPHRGRGFGRAVLAELEQTAAAAGRLRAVLETGSRQPEAITLYLRSGYEPIPPFGVYRCDPDSRCFAKLLQREFRRDPICPRHAHADGAPFHVHQSDQRRADRAST